MILFFVAFCFAFSGFHIAETGSDSVELFCEKPNGTIFQLKSASIAHIVAEYESVKLHPQRDTLSAQEKWELWEQARKAYARDLNVRDSFLARDRSAIFFGGLLEECVALRGYVINTPPGVYVPHGERSDRILKEHGFRNTIAMLSGVGWIVSELRNGPVETEQHWLTAKRQYFGDAYESVMNDLYPVLKPDADGKVVLGTVTVTVLDRRIAVKRKLHKLNVFECTRPDAWSDEVLTGVVINDQGVMIVCGDL